MAERVTLSLDAMGGDSAPAIVIEGAARALEATPGLRFLLHGDEARLRPMLAEHPALERASEIRHADQAVTMDERPSQALRHGRDTSMRRAIESVRAGEADAVVSAGNTGALMAMAKFCLKTLPGVERPAIGGFFPTVEGRTVMLDLGANVVCDSDNLVQFAMMGIAFAHVALGIERPRVGVLNIGEEELKGNEVVKAAAETLRRTNLPHAEFHGFVEGDQIPTGIVDVVVADGFTGNIALKTAEGTVRLYSAHIRRSFRAGLVSRLGAVLARGAFRRLKQRLDPRAHNGAMFLGLQGVCIKSHGGTDAYGFASAIKVAVDAVRAGLNEEISREMERVSWVLPHEPDGAGRGRGRAD